MARSKSRRRFTVELDDRALRALRKATGPRIRELLEEPLETAARPIVRDAKANAPVQSLYDPRRTPGELRNSIRTEWDEQRLAEKGRLDLVVGSSVYYSLFQELGWIPRGPGNAQSYGERKVREAGQKKSGLRGTGGYGSQGTRFLTRAYDGNKAAARRQAREVLHRKLLQLIKESGVK